MFFECKDTDGLSHSLIQMRISKKIHLLYAKLYNIFPIIFVNWNVIVVYKGTFFVSGNMC